MKGSTIKKIIFRLTASLGSSFIMIVAVLGLTPQYSMALAATTANAANPCVSAPAPAQWKHVVVLMFENKSYTSVIGSTAAPYINSLVSKCGTSSPATSAKNGWHDSNYRVDGTSDGSYVSKPSYATLTSGVPPSVHGLKDDNYATTTSVNNIYNQLNQAGKTFKDYYNAGAGGCSVNFSGGYHDAIRYYTNVASICSAHDFPLSTFMTDVNSGNLPAFSFILPTNSQNMHDNSVASGDAWAQSFLDPLLNSAQYNSGDTAIFFLWDEDTPIPNVLIAPSIVAGSKVPLQTGNPISHFSALRTWEEMLGLPFIGNVGQAPSLLSYYNGGGAPVPTTPPTAGPSPTPSRTPTPTPVPAGVDLIVTNVSWSPTSPVAGQAVTFSATIKNQGTGPTTAGVINGVRFSVDGVLGPWSDNNTSSIPAGGSITVTANGGPSGATYTPATAKTYTVQAFIDDQNRIVETNESNNTLSASMVVGNTGSTPVPTSGCPILPTDKGTATTSLNIATAGTYAIWSRMMAADSTNNSYYLQIDNSCGIDVGDNSTLSASAWTWLTYRDGNTASKTTVNLTAGSHVIKMIGKESGVKLDKLIFLTDQTCVPTGFGDNCTVAATATPATQPTVTTAPVTNTPTPRPTTATTPTSTAGSDLVVTDIIYSPSEPLPGDQVTFSATIKNQGTTATPNGVIHGVRFYVNGTPSTWSDNRTASIPAGASVTVTANGSPTGVATWTAGTAGVYTIRAFVDDQNRISESNETNNNFERPLTVMSGVTPTPNPTNTPMPTATPVPNSIRAAVTLLLHGIGKAGDNVSPGSTGNTTPVTPQRSVVLQFINSQNVVVSQATGLVTYNNTTGDFRGTIDAGVALPSGTYIVKAKSPNYLSSQIGSFFTLSQGQTTTLPTASLIVGDSNNDNVMNILDYNILLDCYSVFEPAKNCDATKQKQADLNDDGKVNTIDTTLWQREISVQIGN